MWGKKLMTKEWIEVTLANTVARAGESSKIMGLAKI